MNKKIKNALYEWKEVVVVFPIIVIIFSVFRFINLSILPVFADEAIYIRWAQVMKAEPTLRFLPLSDGKQPLFMWLVIPFLKIFEDPLLAGRAVSVFSGLGSLAGIFALSYVLFKNKKTALFASFIYAISPFMVFFDRMALVDSLLTMFGIWTLFFSVLTARHMRLDTAMLSGFALGGALLTKSPAIFFALLLPSTALLVKWNKKNQSRALQLIKLASLWLVTWTIGFAMYNILRLGPNFHLITSRNEDYVFPLSHLFENPLDPFLPYIDRSLEWLISMGTSLVFVFFAVALVLNIKKYYKEFAILLIWSVLPILVEAEFAKVFTARYILFALPPLIIIAASSIMPLTLNPDKSVFKKVLTPVLIVLFFMQTAIFNMKLLTDPESAPLPRSERSGYLEEWTSGTGINDISKFLEKEATANPEKTIVVGTEGYFGTLPDGLQIYTQDTPNLVVVGIGLGINKVPEPLVESKKAGNKTYLVVNSSRLLIDDLKAHGLEVVKQYKKAKRPEFVREYIHHGEFDTLYLLEVKNI